MANILDILGTKYDPTKDLKDNLKTAKLGSWNVRNVPVYAVMSDRDIPTGFSAIVRTNPLDRTKRDVLGETKGRFNLQTNEFMATTLQELRDEMNRDSHLGLEFHSMGELDGGKKVFVSLYSAEWGVYLIGLMSYDQTIPASIQAAVELPGGGLMNLELSEGLTGRFPLAAQNLVEQVRQYRSAVKDLAEDTSCDAYGTTDTMGAIYRALGLPEGTVKTSTMTRYANKAEQVLKFLPEQNRFTQWDVFCAVCAWVDFAAPVRGAKLGELKTLRAEQGLLKPYRKQDAFNRLFNPVS